MKTLLVRPAFACTAAVLVAGLAAPVTPAQEDLPIRRVVLYKHGLGYFEREGAVTGDARVALRFRQDEMSDVLKTLTVLDLGGGRIDSIAYDSQKPPEKVLSEFSFDLRTDDVMQALLRQLRGARVSADMAGRGPIAGAVLGLDFRSERRGEQEVRIPWLSLLSDGGAIIGADLFDLRELSFDDAALAAEVSRYLAVLRTTHRRDEKQVELVCAGEGERAVFASYAIEQPVWKATYRLVIDAERPPYLQGWAVVDNTSEDDWTDVQLSLVAGLPVSFRQDLYTPQFRQRPELILDEQAYFDANALLDRDGEERFAQSEATRRSKGPGDSTTPSPAAPMTAGGGAGGRYGLRKTTVEDALREQASESVTRELGDLLEYRIDHPVTIARNRSALLPIVAGPVAGERVALYDESLRAGNPMSAVHLENTTGLTLEGGPLTVLEEETYAGEAPVATLKPGEKRYVPFAVELGVKATTKLDTKSQKVHHVSFVRGTMISRYFQVETKTYTFQNKNDESRTIVVEHPRRPNLELRGESKPIETELDRYRFAVEAPAAKEVALRVTEAQELRSSLSIGNFTTETIESYESQGLLNAQALEALREVVARKTEIARVQHEIERRRRQVTDVEKNQSRIRDNLRALGSTAEEKDLRSSYVQRLEQDETTLATLRAELDALEQEAREKQDALDRYLQDFALDYSI